jgi:hypothetical protein
VLPGQQRQRLDGALEQVECLDLNKSVSLAVWNCRLVQQEATEEAVQGVFEEAELRGASQEAVSWTRKPRNLHVA